jgi:hypothetical protein
MTNPWVFASVGYLVLAAITFVPTLLAIFRRVRLNGGSPSFRDSPHFSDGAKLLLEQHDQRILGTLGFWKNQAAKYGRFHFYVLSWTIPSAILIPILTQVGDGSVPARAFLTIVSAQTAVLLAFHRALRVEANFAAFRSGESDFYDLRRRLLDRPAVLGATEEDRVQRYFAETEIIRKLVRQAETNNFPTVEEIRTYVSGR